MVATKGQCYLNIETGKLIAKVFRFLKCFSVCCNWTLKHVAACAVGAKLSYVKRRMCRGVENIRSRYVQGLGINLLAARVNKLMKIKKQKGNGGQMGGKCAVWLLPRVVHLVLRPAPCSPRRGCSPAGRSRSAARPPEPRGALVVQTEERDHRLSA